MKPLALPDPEKIRAPLQRGTGGRFCEIGVSMVSGRSRIFRSVLREGGRRKLRDRSGGQTLAAPSPARGDHIAAADRRHAGPKTVPALANELASGW